MKDEPIKNPCSAPICSSFISVSLILLAAAFINISPMLLRHIGTDMWMYLVWMRCFSEQLWQGDLYPRWCMDVNDGLGTPLFLFYFPLPFYVAAVFQPLVQLGLSYYGLFTLLCFLASFCAMAACFSWLKDVVEPCYALLASILFVFLPYHAEMMFFRGAYSEIWGAVWLPLVFKYTRRIARGEGRSVLPLAIVTGLSLLTHIPLAAEALLFAALYVMAMTGRAWRPKRHFALAALWGFALAAFYLVPGMYYHRFLASSELAKGLFGWANNFLTPAFLKIPGLDRPLLAAALGMLLLAGMAITIIIRRASIEDVFIRRETMVWLVISLLALFMLFPASAPLYALMGPFSKAVFPWRMQMIATLGMTFMLAVWMQWLIPPTHRKTWKLDYGLAIVFLWVLSNILVSSFSPARTVLNEQARQAKIVFAREYRTQWTDPQHGVYTYLLSRRGHDVPKADIASGVGRVTVEQWDWRGIVVDVRSKKPVTVRIQHSYFPVWRAAIDKGETLPIHPENNTGLMLLDVPGGRHGVTLVYSAVNGNRYLIVSQWLSAMALLALTGGRLRAKFFDKLGSGC